MSALAFATSAPLTVGQQIAGCYILKQRLATGDLRDLWLARDEVLAKDVTVFFLPEAILQDARAVADLRQEVKRNRQLSHPNILRVYDFVEDGGRSAITMDKLDAECLSDLLEQKGAFEGHEIKAWMAQIAETLSDAHRIQLFHRDLSAANLFVRPGGKVVITSFGISRLVYEALERAGEVKGEAAHLAGMSPQLLDGERPSASDDVYGLGALAFTLLTGRAPFTGENLVPQIRKVAAPSVNAIRTADRRSPVSAGWEQVIAACLSKSPEQRPKSCGEIVALLAQEKSTPTAEAAPLAAAQEVSTLPSAPSPAATSTSATREAMLSATREALRVPVPPVPEEPKAPTKYEATEVSRLPMPTSAPKTVADSVPNLPPPVPAMKPKPKPAPLSANYPDLDRPKSKLPMVALLLAAAALGTGIYLKNTDPVADDQGNGDKQDTQTEDGSLRGPEKPPEGIANKGTETEAPVAPPAGVPSTPADVTPPPAVPETPVAAVPPAPEAPVKPPIGAESPAKPTEEPLIVAANAGKVKPGPAKVAEPKAPREGTESGAAKTPEGAPASAPEVKSGVALPAAPPPLPKLVIPQNATTEQLQQLLAEREAAAEEFARVEAEAKKRHAANVAMRDVKQGELDEQKRALEEKRKELGPVIKAAADVETEKKRLEENRVRTDAAAKEASKAADAAKLALEQLLVNGNAKMVAKEKAETELKGVTQTVTEGSKLLDEYSQGATRAEALRQQMLLAKKQTDQEMQTLTTAMEKATKAQRDAMRIKNKGQIESIEKQIREVDSQVDKLQKALMSLQAIEDETNKPTIVSLQGKISEATAKKAAFQDEVKRLSGATPIKPAPAPVRTETPPTPPAVPPVKQDPPAKPPTAAETAKPPVTPVVTPVNLPVTPADPAAVAETNPGANSLGMKFASVGDVQFSVHLVTRKNFQAFADSTNHKAEHWKNPGFAQTPDHPVVNVTWKDADGFCKWLTEKEHKGGQLKNAEAYRLPTDLEWSKAVGLPSESGATPEDRDMGVADVYPWGTNWPPPEGAGNFAGEETVTELPIVGYNDKFPNTSPVGSFKANKAGLYDMGGNVWQWVQDSFDNSGNSKTLRGGSWYNGSLKLSLLSSCRIKSSADQLNDTYGFRIVKAKAAR